MADFTTRNFNGIMEQQILKQQNRYYKFIFGRY